MTNVIDFRSKPKTKHKATPDSLVDFLTQRITEFGDKLYVLVTTETDIMDFGSDNWQWFKQGLGELNHSEPIVFIIKRFEQERFNAKIPYKSVCSVIWNKPNLIENDAAFTEDRYRTDADTGKPLPYDVEVESCGFMSLSDMFNSNGLVNKERVVN